MHSIPFIYMIINKLRLKYDMLPSILVLIQQCHCKICFSFSKSANTPPPSIPLYYHSLTRSLITDTFHIYSTVVPCIGLVIDGVHGSILHHIHPHIFCSKYRPPRVISTTTTSIIGRSVWFKDQQSSQWG